MTTIRGRILFATVSALSLCAVGSAFAQTAPAPAPVANSGGGGEIVVTAQKREQSLISVPVAISAFTSAQRDKIGIDSVQDMTNFTPGLSYNTGNDRVTLRGIGRYTNQLSADSSVGVYEDGAFTTFTTKAGEDSLFVDRIEVLRGPQGTLYGRNSIGGALNIISRQPTNQPYAEIRATVDTYGYHVLEGAVSGPITDHMQARLSASWIGQTGGYFNNLNGLRDEGNKRNEFYGELQLRGDWGTHFDWWVKGFVGSWQNNGGNSGGRISNSVVVGADGNTPLSGASAFYPVNIRKNALGLLSPVETSDSLAPSLGGFLQTGVTALQTVNSAGTNPGNSDIRNYYSLHPQTQDVQRYMGIAAHLTGHFNGFDVKYVGSANRYSYIEQEEWGEGQQLATGVISYKNPAGFTISPDTELFYAEYHWFTQNEINFLSNGNGPVQWVVGAYNFNEGYKQPELVYAPGQAELANPVQPCIITGACAAPIAAAANPMRAYTNGQAHMGAETFAGFGQVDWSITPQWKLTGGVRYTYDSKWGIDGAQEYTYLPVQGINLPLAITIISPYLGTVPGAQKGATAAFYNSTNGLYERKLSGDWDAVTGTAGVQYQPDRDTNFYAKFSRGYKSGGFNAGSLLATNPETDPEHSNDYQIGFKKSFNRNFQISLDAFYDQYYDAQVPIGVANTSGVVTTSFYNVPESRSSGVEAEITWSPIHSLQLLLDYGYNDTSIVKSGCVVDSNDPTATLNGATPGGCTGGSQNLKGNALPNAPKNKVALNANYTIDLPTGALTLSGSYIWRDKQYGSIFQRAQYQAPSWDQVDLRVEYKPTGGHWTLIAYGKNIFDSTGYINGAGAVSQSNGTFIKQYTLTPPAIGGFEFQYKF